MGALDQPFVLNRNKCLSNFLQIDRLPEKAQAVMENRVGDCEICQQVCPWNKKHLDNPLQTNLTRSFREKIETWETFFYLPDLVELTEEGYEAALWSMNTDIPYDVFHRNVKIALEKAKMSSERTAG